MWKVCLTFPQSHVWITYAFSQQSLRDFLSSTLLLLYTPSGTHPSPPPRTRRVSESAPSESSKGDRGGNESFKHRVPLLQPRPPQRRGRAWETGSQVLGVRGSLGIQNDHWRAASLETGCHCLWSGKASAFTDRRPAARPLFRRLSMQRDERWLHLTGPTSAHIRFSWGSAWRGRYSEFWAFQ